MFTIVNFVIEPRRRLKSKQDLVDWVVEREEYNSISYNQNSQQMTKLLSLVESLQPSPTILQQKEKNDVVLKEEEIQNQTSTNKKLDIIREYVGKIQMNTKYVTEKTKVLANKEFLGGISIGVIFYGISMFF